MDSSPGGDPIFCRRRHRQFLVRRRSCTGASRPRPDRILDVTSFPRSHARHARPIVPPADGTYCEKGRNAVLRLPAVQDYPDQRRADDRSSPGWWRRFWSSRRIERRSRYAQLFDGLLSCVMLTACHIDARFEVLGSPYSLLSVTLSPSQQLFTRRGTLVGVAGKAENVRLQQISCFLSHVLTSVPSRPSPPCRFSLPSHEPSSAFPFSTSESPLRRPSRPSFPPSRRPRPSRCSTSMARPTT